MKGTYIEMTKYLLKSLPLKSSVLKDAACLGPLTWKKEWTAQSIGRLALRIPHIIQEREVSLVKDEWKLYQLEEIPVEWYNDENGNFKRVDSYWAQIFKIRDGSGNVKYKHLAKIVKSILSLPNGNVSVERSLSDNKNMLTSERTRLAKETMERLRRAKEFARGCGGSHNINALNRGVFHFSDL